MKMIKKKKKKEEEKKIEEKKDVNNFKKVKNQCQKQKTFQIKTL